MLLATAFRKAVGCDSGAAADGEFHVRLEFLGHIGGETEVLLDVGGGEGLGGVECDGLFSFLADEFFTDFFVFHGREFEGDEGGDATLFFVAFVVDFNGFAIDVVVFADGLRGLEFSVLFGEVVNLFVGVFGGGLDLSHLHIDFVPMDFDLGHIGGVEDEGEGGLGGEVGSGGQLVVGEGAAHDLDLFVVNIFVERLAQHVLHFVGDDGGLVHTLDEAHRSHTFAESRDGGLVLIVFQLFVDAFFVVVFVDFDFDAKV